MSVLVLQQFPYRRWFLCLR